MQNKTIFWELQHSNPELYDLVQLAYHGFKYAGSTERQYRLAALLPVLSYARIASAEVRWIKGTWRVGVSKEEADLRDRFLTELKAIHLSETKDEDVVKGELASLFEKYHKQPRRWWKIW